MAETADTLIRRFQLAPHPEGGHFREVFRSSSLVTCPDGRGERACMTECLFLLREGEHSAWHRVRSDECWHFVEGAALELFEVSVEDSAALRVRMGSEDVSDVPSHVVRAGHWQAARTSGAFTLASCTVAPGFAFEDFSLLSAADADWELVRGLVPEAAVLLRDTA